MHPKILIYDGTFKGLLTCIFQIYEEKLTEYNIHPEGYNQNDFFANQEHVITDEERKVKIRILNNSANKKGFAPSSKMGLSHPIRLPNHINPKI